MSHEDATFGPCCERTVEEVPGALHCVHGCGRLIVRCSRCGRPASGSGFCGRCIVIRAQARAVRGSPAGPETAFEFRLANQGPARLWVAGVEWAAAGRRDSHELRDGAWLERGEARAWTLDRVSATGTHVVADVEVGAGVSPRDVHHQSVRRFRVGAVTQAEGGGGVNVHGPLVVRPGAVLAGRDYVVGPRREADPTAGRAWRDVPLVPRAAIFLPPAGPVVDRRTRVVWPDPKSGRTQTARFARRPWLVLGRLARPRIEEANGDAADLRWHPVYRGEGRARDMAMRVSRRHAYLRVAFGRLWIEDNSTNGTSLNDEGVFRSDGPVALCEGDRLAPWGPADAGRSGGLGSWQVSFRADAGGRAEEALFRHRKE